MAERRVTNAEFKESERVELWSKRLVLDASYNEFYHRAKAVAAGINQRFTGFIERDFTNGVASFTRTRYPRAKYGITDVADCEQGMLELAKAFKGTLEDDKVDGFRVLLGLREGYGADGRLYSYYDAAAALGQQFEVRPAEIYALRFGTAVVDVYTEPAALILGPSGLEQPVYELAEIFGQERFAVEDFDKGLVYMVETSHCTEPDL